MVKMLIIVIMMEEGFYHLTTPNYLFHCFVFTYGGTTVLQVGRPRRKSTMPCIEIRISGKKAHISNLEFGNDCDTSEQLDRGKGTIEMIQGTLRMLVDTYPFIKQVTLNDTSQFPCGDVWIDLPYVSMLLYGKTWYERMFRAKAKSKVARDALDTLRRMLQETPDRNKLNVHGVQYEDYNNWMDLFKGVRRHVGCKAFHDMKYALRKFVNVDMMYMEFAIRSKDILDYPVTIELARITNYVGGGIDIPPCRVK